MSSVIPQPQRWGAVLAMSLAAFALVASEFMPVSLLTPLAADLHITEGQAGQGISVSGVFALLTSLVIAAVAARMDRKRLLMALTLLMIVSGSVVAFAPNYAVFMFGRALIGVAIGGDKIMRKASAWFSAYWSAITPASSDPALLDELGPGLCAELDQVCGPKVLGGSAPNASRKIRRSAQVAARVWRELSNATPPTTVEK